MYRGEQRPLKRDVVVKVLHQRLRHDNVALQRFLREARLASRFDHPYAAHVYAFGVEAQDGLMWIAMEMVQGITLDDWVETRGPIPLDQFVPFFECVAEVVQAAHEQGIVHRDLEPSNVMVIERGGRLFPKLLDFGIAKVNDEVALPIPQSWPDGSLAESHEPVSPHPDPAIGVPANRRELTRPGVGIGSRAYMSPEQWHDAGAVGLATVPPRPSSFRRLSAAGLATNFASVRSPRDRLLAPDRREVS